MTNFDCVGKGVISPRNNYTKSPVILDETIPKTKSPEEIEKEIEAWRYEKMIQKLKQKNPEELSMAERYMLAVYNFQKKYHNFADSTIIYSA